MHAEHEFSGLRWHVNVPMQSDSECDVPRDKESSDEDVPVAQDSNDKQSQSEQSDVPDIDTSLRRRKITKSSTVELLIVKNGCKRSTNPKPGSQTAAANIVNQRKGLTLSGQ